MKKSPLKITEKEFAQRESLWADYIEANQATQDEWAKISEEYKNLSLKFDRINSVLCKTFRDPSRFAYHANRMHHAMQSLENKLTEHHSALNVIMRQLSDEYFTN